LTLISTSASSLHSVLKTNNLRKAVLPVPNLSQVQAPSVSVSNSSLIGILIRMSMSSFQTKHGHSIEVLLRMSEENGKTTAIMTQAPRVLISKDSQMILRTLRTTQLCYFTFAHTTQQVLTQHPNNGTKSLTLSKPKTTLPLLTLLTKVSLQAVLREMLTL
jgi:hypothetical protein